MQFIENNSFSSLEVIMLLIILSLLIILVSTQWRTKHSNQNSFKNTEEIKNTLIAIRTEFGEKVSQLKDRQLEGEKGVINSLRDQEKVITTKLEITSEKTSTTLSQLHERMAVIDSAQKKIADLSNSVISLKDILSNNQARGAFGEQQMAELVRDQLPSNYFKFQALLSNGCIADCLITLPSQVAIAVDSKYPLEAYQRLINSQSETDKKNAKGDFKRDVMKHIKDVSKKYIIPGETADIAIMFIPAESVYWEINRNFQTIVDEGRRQSIMLASPSSLWALLNAANALIKDKKMLEQAGAIKHSIGLVLEDVKRLDQRVKKLNTHFKLATEDIDLITKSTSSVTRRGEKIKEMELENNTQKGIEH